MRFTSLCTLHAFAGPALALRDSINGLDETLPQQLPSYNQIMKCAPGTADCEYARLQFQTGVQAKNTKLQATNAPQVIASIAKVAENTASLQTGIDNINSALTAPTALNGVQSGVSDMKVALIAIQRLITSLVTSTGQKAKSAQKNAAMLVQQTASDTQSKMNSYLVSLQSIVRQLDQQIAIASSQQLANFKATAAAVGSNTNKTLLTANNGVSAAAKDVKATGSIINTSLNTTASSISDASSTVSAIAKRTEQGATLAEVKLHGTVLAGESGVVDALNKTASSTVASTQQQAKQYAQGLSGSISQQDTLMASALKSLNSAGATAANSINRKISSNFEEANSMLASISGGLSQNASDISSGFSAVAQDASNAVTDSAKLVSAQSAGYSQLSGSTQAELASLMQTLGTAFTGTQTKFASMLDSHSGDASKAIQRQNANLGTVNDGISQSLQAMVNSAMTDAASAQQAHGQNSVDVENQIQGANDMIGQITTTLSGKIKVTTGAQKSRLGNAASTVQSGMSSLASLLASINSQNADTLSEAATSVDGSIADATDRLSRQLDSVSGAASQGFSDLNSIVARTSSGLNGDVSALADILQALLVGVGSSSDGVAAQQSTLAALGLYSGMKIASLKDKIAQLSSGAASAVQGNQADAKKLLNQALLGVGGYQANVTTEVTNIIQKMLTELQTSNGATQEALSQSGAAASSIVSGATSQLSAASNMKASFEQQVASLGQQTSAASQNILNAAGSQHSRFLSQLQSSYADHQAQVKQFLANYLAQTLSNAMNATNQTLGSSGAQLQAVMKELTDLETRAKGSLDLVTDGINSLPIDKQNLQAQADEVQQAFLSAQASTDGKLDETYDDILKTMAAKNDSIQTTFADLQEKANNVTDLVQNAGQTLMKNVAAQQLQIDGFINQLKQVMNLSAMQDAANMQAEMAAQLSKLNSSSNAVNSSAADITSAVISQNAERIARNTQLAAGLEGVVDAAKATIAGSSAAEDATRASLVAAGKVADVAFTGIEEKMNQQSSEFSSALADQQAKQSRQISAAELEASRQSNAISADAASAAQQWEGSVQSGLAKVSDNTQALTVLFSNLAAINSSVLEDLSSMMDAITAAYGSSILDANSSSTHSRKSFARVQDVITVFGDIIQQFVEESTNNMNSAKSDAAVIGSMVSQRLDELDERVNDQIRWLETGTNSTADAQTNGLHSIRAMQESEKQAIAEVDGSLKSMDNDITASVNSIEASLTSSKASSSEWAASVMRKVSGWQTAARSKFADKLIAAQGSFLDKGKRS